MNILTPQDELNPRVKEEISRSTKSAKWMKKISSTDDRQNMEEKFSKKIVILEKNVGNEEELSQIQKTKTVESIITV